MRLEIHQVSNLNCFDCLTEQTIGDKQAKFAQDSPDFVGGKKPPEEVVNCNGVQIGPKCTEEYTGDRAGTKAERLELLWQSFLSTF